MGVALVTIKLMNVVKMTSTSLAQEDKRNYEITKVC